MKEAIRMMKSRDELNKKAKNSNNKITSENSENASN